MVLAYNEGIESELPPALFVAAVNMQMRRSRRRQLAGWIVCIALIAGAFLTIAPRLPAASIRIASYSAAAAEWLAWFLVSPPGCVVSLVGGFLLLGRLSFRARSRS